LSYLPEWVQAIASILPLTYGVEAMRGATDGLGILDVGGDLLMMVVLGAIYFAISIVMFRAFERLARNDGSFDMF